MLTPVVDGQGTNGAAVAGGVVAGLVGFCVWTVLMVAVTYGVSSALGDAGGTAVLIALVVVPLAAAVLLLALPGTRAVGAGFVGGLSGGFLLGAAGALLLFWAAGFSL